jgi:hypothetical protein
VIIEQLREDLVVAAEREYRPRRRGTRLLLPAAAMLIAAVAAGVLLRGPEPEREVAASESPGARGETLRVPGVFPPLKLVARAGENGHLCTSLRDGSGRCVNDFVLTGVFRGNGAPVDYSVKHRAGVYVVTGLVGASVDSLTARSAGGSWATAVIGRRSLAVGRLRVRAFTLSLQPSRTHAGITLTVSDGGVRKRVRVSTEAAPLVGDGQRPRISLLERPAGARDAAAAAELRRAHKSRVVAATARVANRFRGRLVYAYVNRLGEVCLVNYGAVCGSREVVEGGTPMDALTFNVNDPGSVTMVGLIHDGPSTVTVERRDGSTRTVEVVENVFAFRDRDVARVRWVGLRGSQTMDIEPAPAGLGSR